MPLPIGIRFLSTQPCSSNTNSASVTFCMMKVRRKNLATARDGIFWTCTFRCRTQEIGGDRGREYGFAQSALIPVLLPKERLKVGAEMQLTVFSDKGIREDPATGESARFIIGPTIAWKPTKNTRLDVSPLFGVNQDAPRAQVFAVFSYVFGGSEGAEAEAPTSTRNR